ncbi:hypothetical protein DPMN_130001 [Dreissena polymorpha]|uniref:Aldehyde dehydrogenase domain-containing protein n=1 Tax=Dreissena polymorpha TaxID=45954 RepID=A0A9D4K113_DREPO|nr:hypothetical protein DPMN_130001 [Dreissena polymorpha]
MIHAFTYCCFLCNAGYAYTSDAQQIWRIADALECGLLGINEALVSTVEGPHGGVKESGIGREGGVGVGIEDFLEVKYLCIGNQ